MRSMLLLFFMCLISCHGLDHQTTKKHTPTQNIISKNQPSQSTTQPYEHIVFPLSAPRVSDFVRRIFQDKNGHLWFGTNGDGVARYNGESLAYFNIEEGFGGSAVRAIIDDQEGNVWFATNKGITKYDGTSFTNYTEKDGLVHNDVWTMMINRKGIFWIATLQGVNQFDGTTFTYFPLPESKPDHKRGVTSSKIIHSIMQDSKDRMWFGSNDGAYIFDGKSLTNLSEIEGLPTNTINDILEDRQGNIWFATHYKGVSRYDGTTFTNFTEKGIIAGDEVWSLYEDTHGHIWFPAENHGIYEYDGTSFTNYNEPEEMDTNAIQCIFQDRDGNIWAGGWKGLFRKEGAHFQPIFTDGPWENN